jgi:hypothetical protein
MMATDMFGRRFVEVPSVQFTLFCREDYTRRKSGMRAVLCRENGEKATGELDRTPVKRTLFFRADNGMGFSLPLNRLAINVAGDIWVVAVDETAMIEHCELYGLWETSYFPEVR